MDDSYAWSNGDKYEGEFKEDKKSGKGIYNADKYDGNWLNDKLSEFGSNHGNKYKGN